MLVGSFTHYGHTLMLSGYDIAGTFYLQAVPESREAKTYFDSGYFVDDEQEASTWPTTGLIVAVAKSNVKVQKLTTTGTDGGVVANEVNKVAFAALGSLLRSLKSACVPTRRVGFNGISYGHDAYVPEKAYSYDVEGHFVELTQGEVTKLRYDDDNVSLVLTEDPEEPEYTFPFLDSAHQVRISPTMFSGTAETSGVFSVARDGFVPLNEIIARNPEKSYSWLGNQNYIVATPENFVDCVKRIAAHKGIVAFDTETTGLNITFRSMEGVGDRLVGMVFSVEEGESYYFPIEHNLVPNIAPASDIPFVMEKYFKPLLEKKRLVGHNSSFDWKVMYTYGIACNFVADTLIMFRLTLGEKNPSLKLGLKSLATEFLGRDSLELSDFVEGGSWGGGDLTFADLDEESIRWYACADTDNTLALYNYIHNNRLLDEYNAHKVCEIETLFTMCIGYSEYFGMYADPERMVELENHLQDEVDKEYAIMKDLAGQDFNPSSTKDLQFILFDKLGLAPKKYTASGAPSTAKDVLQSYASERNPDDTPKYPFVARLLAYRVSKQLISNFCNVFNKLSNDGFFHSSVRQFLNTGRASVSDPNYQSFNDSAKKYIEARKGYYMFDADFSSVEYRVLVSIAKEQALVEEFFDPDFDYHRRMASMLHGVPYESVTPAIRSQSKGLNFGIPYGMSVKGLAGRMFGDTTNDSVAKAQFLYNKYFETQPKVREFFDKTKANALADGYSETFYGRRRYYDPRKQNQASIKRAAGNHPIQGTAADLYKMGVGRLFLKLKELNLLGKVLIDGFVHDEILIECHNSINPAVLLGIVREALMVPNEGWCPLYIGAGFGKSWYDAKKIELPVQVQETIIDSGAIEWWDGNAEKLGPWATGVINGYKLTRVKDYFADANNKGKKLPPTELGFVSELLKSVTKGENIDGFAGGVDVPPYSGLYEELRVFAGVFGLPEGIADFVRIDDEVVATDDFGINRYTADDITFNEVEDQTYLHTSRALMLGSSMDPEEEVLYLANYRTGGIATVWGAKIPSILTENPGGYSVVLVDETTSALQTTDIKVSPRAFIQINAFKKSVGV